MTTLTVAIPDKDLVLKKLNSNVVHIRGLMNGESGEYCNDAQGEGVLVDENGANILPWPLPAFYDQQSDGDYRLCIPASFDPPAGSYTLRITLDSAGLQFHRELLAQVGCDR